MAVSSPFKLSLCGRFVVEDDGSPHPTVWTRGDADQRRVRLERLAADNERDAELARAEGRLTDVDAFGRCADRALSMALDLLLVLQGTDQKAAA